MCAMTHTPASNPLIGALNFVLLHVEGTTFAEWLAARRTAGDSYRTIAADLESLTDGHVAVSGESIRRYCLELGVEVAA